MGDNTPGDASRLHFLSFGVEAARVLEEERRIGAIGMDVASIDYGQSIDFHVTGLRRRTTWWGWRTNHWGLDVLPPTGR